MFKAVNGSFRVLGVRIDAVQIPDVVGRMEQWIAARCGQHFITLTNVHSVMETQHEAGFRQMLEAADLSVPDGMPLVWLGRSSGFPLKRRVYGPDLLIHFCLETHKKGYTHYFLGGVPGVPEQLASTLTEQFPGLGVVGTFSPPFGSHTPEEDAAIVGRINRASPDVLWVGLGCPKQERWMYEHRERLCVPVMAGVGQAFDIYSGRVRQAPPWMREHGGEWLFRLCQNPRRLWRRYLFCNTQFLYRLILERSGLNRFD